MRLPPSNPSQRIDSARGESQPLPADPWEAAATDYEWRDNWLLSYIDILTLFLFLVIVLLVLQPQEQMSPLDTVLPGSPTAVPEPPEPRASFAASMPANPLPATAAAAISERRLAEAPDDAVTEVEPMIAPVAAEAPSASVEQDNGAGDTITVPVINDPAAPNQEVSDAEPNGVEKLMQQLTTETLADRLEVSKVTEGVHLEVHGNILFAPGSDILILEGRQLLADLVKIFTGHNGMISVEGHSDDRPIASPRFPSNWELSAARATGVARYLIKHGFEPAQLRTVGYADTRPLASNGTAEGRARNRRVTLIVLFPDR